MESKRDAYFFEFEDGKWKMVGGCGRVLNYLHIEITLLHKIGFYSRKMYSLKSYVSTNY